MVADKGKQGEALRKEGATWLDRVNAAGKAEKLWMDDAEKAVKAYSGEMSSDTAPGTTVNLGDTYDFNILFSNVETIVPAVINSPPAPDIRRRFADDDPAAKDVSELLERAIRIQVDDSKLQVELEAQAQDAFLAGRGVVRLRFKSDFLTGTSNDELRAADVDREAGASEGGQYDAGGLAESADEADIGQRATVPSERLANERITFEAVSWRDYRHGPAKRWDERPWEAFRFCIAREDESTSFDAGLIGSQTTDAEKNSRGESKSDLTGWEIWCKKSKKVKFIDDDGVILKVVDDPLGLTNFFCTSTPVQPIEVTGRLMPVNPFSIYRRLADELDLTTKRINVITKHMKVKGWYPGNAADLANMLNADDVDFVPLAEPEIWAANGGLAGAVAFWPAEKFVIVLRELYVARQETKQAIYEITGISDIVRGASDAKETLGAQQIKTQWGSLRIQKMQRMMERTARDLFVMMAELIPAKFSPETLQKMTGIQLIPTEQDMMPVQMPPIPPGAPPEAIQQAQAAQQEAEKTRQAKLAKMQAVGALLNQQLGMLYRIDVESDSTVKADLTRQKAELTEFLTGSAAYWQAMVPAIQEGVITQEAAADIFMASARLFNLGKSVEDTLEKMMTDAKAKSQQPKPPSPEQQKAEADAKGREQDAALKEREMQGKEAAAERQAQRDDAADQRKVATEQTLASLSVEMKKLDLQIKAIELQMKERESVMSLHAKAAETTMKLSAQKQANDMKAKQPNGKAAS